MRITEEEKRAVQMYSGVHYKLINSILETDMASEEDYLSKSSTRPEVFSEEFVRDAVKNIKLIYSAMLKYSESRSYGINKVYRGTSQGDVNRMIANKGLNKFVSATLDRSMARGYFSLTWDEPAVLEIDIEQGVPYLDMADVLDDYGQNGEKEILLSPFLSTGRVTETGSFWQSTESGEKNQKVYSTYLTKRALPELSKEERARLEKEVFDNVESIEEKRKRYFELAKSIDEAEFFAERNEENIKKLTMQLKGRDISASERREFEEDLEYLTGERADELKQISERYTAERTALKKDIEEWKGKVAQICMADCREAENDIKRIKEEVKVFEEKRRFEKEEAQKRINEQKAKAAAAEEKAVRGEQANIKNMHSYTCKSIKSRVDGISNEAKSALKSRSDLAELASRLGISYVSYIDVLRNLPGCISEFYNKLNGFAELSNGIELKDGEDIDTARFSGLQIKAGCERLLSASRDIKDIPVKTLKDMEENSFKQGIYDKVLNAKFDIFADILKDEVMRIDGIKGLKKFFYKITGKEAENIKRRTILMNSVRGIYGCKKEISEGICFSEKPSIHKIMAEITQLQNEYGGNQRYAKELAELAKLKTGISDIYRVDETRVNEIMQNEYARRVPVEAGKKYNEADLIMGRVNVMLRKSRSRIPPVRSFDTERSIREMSDIMRDITSAGDRRRQVERGMSR